VYIPLILPMRHLIKPATERPAELSQTRAAA
jgi:hypothetical protein